MWFLQLRFNNAEFYTGNTVDTKYGFIIEILLYPRKNSLNTTRYCIYLKGSTYWNERKNFVQGLFTSLVMLRSQYVNSIAQINVSRDVAYYKKENFGKLL